MKLIKDLTVNGKIQPPKWLPDNILFAGITGSYAYGVSDDTSDKDIYGIVIPPVNTIFPHLAGEIQGFSTPKNRFDQWQQHHIKHNDEEYDLTFFNIVKFFQLAMHNNPNILDLLFLPQHCIIHSTMTWKKITDNKNKFLHKGLYQKFIGYSFSQKNKIKTQSNKSNEKRKKSYELYGYDTKFAFHCMRLLMEAEQLLNTGNLDLTKDKEILKSIRRGEWSIDQIDNFFEKKESHLQTLYENSKLPHSPNEDIIRDLLMECIEDHYGKVSMKVNMDSNLLDDIEDVLRKYKG